MNTHTNTHLERVGRCMRKDSTDERWALGGGGMVGAHRFTHIITRLQTHKHTQKNTGLISTIVLSSETRGLNRPGVTAAQLNGYKG